MTQEQLDAIYLQQVQDYNNNQELEKFKNIMQIVAAFCTIVWTMYLITSKSK